MVIRFAYKATRAELIRYDTRYWGIEIWYGAEDYYYIVVNRKVYRTLFKQYKQVKMLIDLLMELNQI